MQLDEMNEKTATILTPLSDEESHNLNVLKQANNPKDLFEIIDQLYQSHQVAGHELAVEMLEEMDSRSEFFQAKVKYDEMLADKSIPIDKINLQEIHLKALHPISVLRSLA